MSVSSPESPGRGVPATEVLRAGRFWIGPVLVAAVFAALVAAAYIGSTVWYDHRRPERISPDPTDLPDRTDGHAVANRTADPVTD